VTIIFLAFPHEFDSVLDGMVYAAITALGFAATENLLYLYFAGYGEGGYAGLGALFVLRVILGGWGHAVYTSFIGIGLAVARLRPEPWLKVAAPLAGWLVAVFLHALHNTMATVFIASFGLGGLAATLLVDWVSWAIALGIVCWAILRERRWVREYLREELEQGTISAAQYQTASSLRRQWGARMRSKEARRFYGLCSELAQKKHQLAVVGEERGNTARVARLRAEIAQLAPLV
jgi:protease PrsW